MKNKIIKGDIFTTLFKLDDHSFDLVVADPPYNISIAKWDEFKTKEKYFEFMKNWIKIVYKKMKNDSSIFLYNNEYNSALLIPILEEVGFEFKNWITWVKRDGMASAKRRFVNSQEVILFFTKGNPKFNYNDIREPYLNEERIKHAFEKGILKNGKRWFPNPNGRLKTNVWEDTSHRQVNKINGKNKKASHPTIKPLSQLEMIIKSASDENDLILDIFSGSGTTSVACKNLNRNSIALERDSKYINLIKERLKNGK